MSLLRQITCAVILICLASPVAFAQQTTQIKLIADGESITVERDLINSLEQTGLDDWPNEVQNWYYKRGFLDASADSFLTDTDPPELYLTEGCRYTLSELNIENKISAEFSSSDRFTGEVFTEELTSIITAYYLFELEQEGYLTAEFQIIEAVKDSDECSIKLTAELRGEDVYQVKGIRFDGVERNNPEYLEKVTGIRSGSVITPEIMERGRRNLLNTELFADVGPGELIFVNGEPHINYEVTEQQLNFFDGLIGYVPQADGSGQLAGYGDILLRNALADGNHLAIRYEQLQPLVSKLDINAGQQLIGGIPLRGEAGLSFVQQDTTYLVRNITAEAGYRIFTGFEFIGTLRAERSSVSRTMQAEPAALDSRARFYGLGFRYRQLDRITVPTRGYDARVMLEQGRRFLNDERLEERADRSYRQTILKSSIRGYYPISNRFVLAARADAYLLDSPEYIITDLYRFGGANTIRGYREDQFRASSVLWGDLEPRFLLDRNSYLFIFGAYGLFERPQLITESTGQFSQNTDLKSFGFGLAFQSPIGLIKFSYAVSPDDNLSDGKVHVGISTGI